MWGAVASVLLFLDSMIRHNCFYEGPFISGKIKSCLIALIFKKILNLTQQTANLEQLGRVSNMLSNDFNMMEIKAPFFFGLCTFPIAYAAFLGVLIYRLGVQGIICLGVPLFFIPFQIGLGKVIGKLLVDVNIHKDKRVKITSEVIDAIKFIKIYGWE